MTVAGGYVAAWAVLAASITAIGLLLTKAVLSDGHGRWDESINRWLAEHRVAFWNHVTSAATFMANTLPVVVLLVLVAAVLVLLHRWREALFLVGALGFELTVFLVANAIVDRPRPDVPRLDSTPSTSSFPSGHIAATLALWCGTALIVNGTVRNRVVRIVAWVARRPGEPDRGVRPDVPGHAPPDRRRGRCPARRRRAGRLGLRRPGRDRGR